MPACQWHVCVRARAWINVSGWVNELVKELARVIGRILQFLCLSVSVCLGVRVWECCCMWEYVCVCLCVRAHECMSVCVCCSI